MAYLKEMRVLITGASVGSLLITVKCDSLEVLEGLWEDYASGHLGKVVQKCFVTEEILQELNLAELKLKTTISEEQYKACKIYCEKKESKDPKLAEIKLKTTISEEEYEAGKVYIEEVQALVCDIQPGSADDSPDESESQTSDSGISECSSIEDPPPVLSGLTDIPGMAEPATMTTQIHGDALLPIKTGAVPSSDSFNEPRKIPKGVFVVCDDFLFKNFKRAASIFEKSKACKGCENRSRLKYAVWSDNTKQWQIIRPYPKVAFKECAHYYAGKPCLKTPCSFAHGQQELIMWTMEREGILPSPRKTLIGASRRPSEQPRYRPPPPGVTDGSYRLCKSCFTHERCRFGRGCLFAHSTEELSEWIQEYHRKKEKFRKDIKEKEKESSFEMVSKILKGPVEDLVDDLPGVAVACTPPELNVKLQDKNDTHKYQWTFNLIFKTNEVGYLEQVLLLHRYHNCYQLSEIRLSCYQETHKNYALCYVAKLKDSWYKSPTTNRPSGQVEVSLTVSFRSSLYGSFDQMVLFDFGEKPYLVQKLNAEVMSEALPQTPLVLERATASGQAIWDENSVEVVRFVQGTSEALQAEHLSRTYSPPKQVEIAAKILTPGVYKTVMHQLLFVEERFMRNEISRYTLTNTQLHAQWSIFDEMTGIKCAVDGELFGVLSLQEEDALRRDDAAGRLLYCNVNSVWLKLADSASNKVYEAPVEKVESECVILRLSSKMCSDLDLHDTCDTAVNAQFQLNRWPLCQMHAAVDRLTKGQLRLIFPEPRTEAVKSEFKIRWQWLLDDRLNANQKKVIEQIAWPEYKAPPLVVFGPFGTGKTFTLYQAVRLLVQVDKSHRILLCTHSNRAADIHVELLDDYLTKKNGVPAARPLRVYQPMRRLETTSETVRKYCLIRDNLFVLPSRDDLVEHRVVVTTLSTSQVLLDLQVLRGFFTHILIDETAQALESEVLTPLIFAGPNTKVVFTGDHMEMSPKVYSPQARSLGLQKSLAERLFDFHNKHKAEAPVLKFQREDPNVLVLTENYRCHKDILQFPSDNFYGEKLVARGHAHQPAHPKYGPLLFFSSRGKEKNEHGNSYINLSEVYEVVKRVKEIANSWPSIWGHKKLCDIAVLSSYRYQVQAIRNSLRKSKDLVDVKVDTVHNVQGESFRVVFISTVRTFHTCKPQQEDRQLYWEFLSDPKLLNTAVTRARCLVAVVGDPVSLCSVGKCRSLWRDYIRRCDEKGGLHGTTMEELDKEINASISTILLNPEAQLFVPGFLQTLKKTIDIPAGKKDEGDQEALEEKTLVEKAVEAQLSEIHGREPRHLLEMSVNVIDSKKVVGQNDPRVSTTAQDHEENEGEEEADDGVAEPGDFQDHLFEDETIFPRDMDEIILAFVRKCEETLQIDKQRKSMFEESEFPTLQAAKDIKHFKDVQDVPFKGGADINDLFPEVRVVNGRVEVRLTNTGFYTAPSKRAKQIILSSKQQEFLDPSVLLRLLEDEPQKYVVCNLRLSPEKAQVGYAEIEDTKTPAIQIKGRVRRAFDKDKVVVELGDKKVRSKTDDSELQVQGKVVGVLEHIISPHERQFVCTTDYENPALMVPINKSATKLVNLTDKTCKDIPIYKKDQNQRATKVRMMKREKVLSGKYLFVVKYLQWRRNFAYPLGIVVRTLPRGDDLKSSMEIAFAEHGIRRVFKEETRKYVKENFPPEWSIPEAERSNRTKVVKAITIDPPTSLDLDDALTIEKASPSTCVVGIHIADVSFFVKPNSPLDDEASLRCTSYYPGEGQENVPMLPRELSEKFCSLLPNEDRLAVSLFVTLDEEGRIAAEPTIKRTVVRSCCRLSYAEAQEVIHGSNISSTGQITDEIVENIKQLSSLAQKRRSLRLGDSGFNHWQDQGSSECFEAHELVEEMMILANEEIAKILSERSSELAPLRVQLPPKNHKLAEWTEAHGKYARFSLKFLHVFKNEPTETSPLKILHDERTMFKIQKSVWAAICKAAETGDLPRLYHLICNENNHPQVAAAISHFRRIQSESRFVCEGDQPPENISHYSLGMRYYTHFTSPIRRYIDIAVHRLLLSLQSDSCHAKTVSKEDIAKVCRRSTFMQDNARKFDKNCKKVHMANQLQQRCRETRVFIESLDHQSISLYVSNQEDDHLANKQKIILLSHLNPVALKEEEESEDREKVIVLKWKFRKYAAPDAIGNIKKVESPGCDGIGGVTEIPSDVWLQVLDAVKSKDDEKLKSIITQAEAKLGIVSSVQGKDKPTQTTPPHSVRGVPYKHPHHNDEATPSSQETVEHFYEKSISLRRYDFASVQLCPHMMRGILQPDIQMFKVNTHINICIEHRRYPRESFAHTARHQASRERYGSIDEYIRAWRPVLAMEAATEAVKENDGFVIEDLNVMWERDLEDESTSGFFTLPFGYCASRQLNFPPPEMLVFPEDDDGFELPPPPPPQWIDDYLQSVCTVDVSEEIPPPPECRDNDPDDLVTKPSQPDSTNQKVTIETAVSNEKPSESGHHFNLSDLDTLKQQLLSHLQELNRYMATMSSEEPLPQPPDVQDYFTPPPLVETETHSNNTPKNDVMDTENNPQTTADQPPDSHTEGVPLTQGTADLPSEYFAEVPLTQITADRENQDGTVGSKLLSEAAARRIPKEQTSPQVVREKPYVATVNDRLQKPPELTVPVQINGKPTRFLVDTGASLSVIEYQHLQELYDGTSPTIYPSSSRDIQTVGGERLPIIGVITATLRVAGGKYPCELKVIKGLTYKAVLGRDFLFENGATINMITNVLELKSNAFPKCEAFTLTRLHGSDSTGTVGLMECAPRVVRRFQKGRLKRGDRSVGKVAQSKPRLCYQRASRAVNNSDANKKPHQPYIGRLKYVNEHPSERTLNHRKMAAPPPKRTVLKQKQADPVNTRQAKDIITSVQKNEGRGRHQEISKVQRKKTYPERSPLPRLDPVARCVSQHTPLQHKVSVSENLSQSASTSDGKCPKFPQQQRAKSNHSAAVNTQSHYYGRCSNPPRSTAPREEAYAFAFTHRENKPFRENTHRSVHTRSKDQQLTSHVGTSLPPAQGKRQTSVKLPGPTKELMKEKMPIIVTKANEDQKHKVTSRCNIKSQRRQIPKTHNQDTQNDVQREIPTAACSEKSSTFDKESALKTPNQDTYTQSLEKLQSSEPRRKREKTCGATNTQVQTQEKVSFSSREHPNNSCTKTFAHNWHDPYKIVGDNPYCEYLTDSPALTGDHRATLKRDNEWRTPCDK